MGLSRVWKGISQLGTSDSIKSNKNRGVVLANQIAFILIISLFLCLGILLNIDYYEQPINLFLLIILFSGILFLNKINLPDTSRILISTIPSLVLFIPVLTGVQIHQVAFIFYSYSMVIFSLIPILVFDIKVEKGLLYTALTINFMAFLLNEQVLFYSQEGSQIQDFFSENFLLIKVVSIFYWVFIVSVLLFLVWYNKKYQMRIDKALEELENRNTEVKLQLEEIMKANEELVQQQDQISDQRDFIERKNEELNEYQEKLLDYVYQITESKDIAARNEAENNSLLMALRQNFIMVEFDIDGVITWIAPKSLKYLQIDEGKIVGKSSLNFIRKVDDEADVNNGFKKLWEKVKKGDSASSDIELTINEKGIHLSSTFAPIFDQNGDVYKVLCISEDVSDIILQKKQIIEINQLLLKQQREIREQNEEVNQQKEEIGAMNETLEGRVKDRTMVLEQKNKQLAEYAFINAHLLRSPVSSILGLINLLKYEKLNKEERDIFNYLKRTVKQLDSIVFKINRAIQQNKDFDREFLRE